MAVFRMRDMDVDDEPAGEPVGAVLGEMRAFCAWKAFLKMI